MSQKNYLHRPRSYVKINFRGICPAIFSLLSQARTAVVDRCKDLITRFGGEIGEIEDWGKKKLAYEIQKMNEAYYYFIPFEAEGSSIHEIESRMRIMDNVIRYLCVKKDEA